MKLFCHILILLIILLTNCLSNSQGFDSVYQLTDGYHDRNPRINYSTKNFPFSISDEMFVFERLLPDSSIHIYAQKINKDGNVDAPVLLTQLTGVPRKNINPTIAYNTNNPLRHILVVWQTDQYEGSKLYGKKYVEGQGWSSEFAVDSSNSMAFTPNTVCLDSINFAITYRKGNDIYFKTYNVLTGGFSPEQNLTPADTFHCANPYVTLETPFNSAYIIVTYEREINLNKHSICYQYKVAFNDTASWSHQDSIAYTGDYKNSGFNEQNLATYLTGTGDIKGTFIYPGSSNFTYTLISASGGSFSNFQGKHFLITDGGGPYTAYGVMEDVALNWNFIKFYVFDSQQLEVEISEINSNIPNTMVSSGPLSNNNCRRFWFIFNSSLSQSSQFESRIFGTWVDNCVTSVFQIGTHLPKSFSLAQNYPNPFNPSTKIRFEIAKQSNVKLEVYNSLGQKLEELVNEELNAGSYEYQFYADELPSGIYYYRLVTAGFTETRKMVLVE